MSKIGKKNIIIPKESSITIEGGNLTITGPKGTKKLTINDSEIAIGILAVLRQFKRHDLFLKMAKSLIKKYPSKRLVFIIAGNGPQKENIEKIVNDLNLAENVKMVGHINNVPEFL